MYKDTRTKISHLGALKHFLIISNTRSYANAGSQLTFEMGERGGAGISKNVTNPGSKAMDRPLVAL